jgi:hypothetical protein
MPDQDQKLIILYVEDKPEILRQYLEFIKAEWSPQSEGVRSREAARELLEFEFKPDVVLHDCQILAFESDDSPSEIAGSELYQLYDLLGLIDRVVVLSGSGEFLSKEPYLSRPPLGLVGKPVGEDKIRAAVQIWRERHNGRAQT